MKIRIARHGPHLKKCSIQDIVQYKAKVPKRGVA